MTTGHEVHRRCGAVSL